MFSIAGTTNGIACEPRPSEIASGMGESMWAASYSLLMVYDSPAGGLYNLDVESMLGIEAHRVRHDDGRRAGNRDEAALEILRFPRPRTLREQLGRSLEREELRERGKRGRDAGQFQEGTAGGALAENGGACPRGGHAGRGP